MGRRLESAMDRMEPDEIGFVFSCLNITLYTLTLHYLILALIREKIKRLSRLVRRPEEAHHLRLPRRVVARAIVGGRARRLEAALEREARRAALQQRDRARHCRLGKLDGLDVVCSGVEGADGIEVVA